MQQKAFDSMTNEEIEAMQRFQHFYPQNRETWIGDILVGIEALHKKLDKIEKELKKESK
jgi:hypothetical protein